MSGVTGIITSAFRGVRIAFSLLGIGSSVGIAGYGVYFVVGGVSGGWAFVAMGAACLIPSIVMLRDAASILEKIKEEGVKLEAQNKILKENNIEYKGENEKLKKTTGELMETKNQYVEQNKQYLDLLQLNKIKLDNLDKLKTDIESENEKLKGNVEQFGSQTQVYISENNELKNNVEKINSLREQFKHDNDELQASLKDAQMKFEALELIKEKYSMENDRLHEMIIENTAQVTNLSKENAVLHDTVVKNEAQVVQLTSQVTRLKELHQQSLQLLINLKEAGDLFTDFGTTIGASVTGLGNVHQDLQGVAQKLEGDIENQIDEFKRLNEGLTQKLVEEMKTKLDTDQDGDIDPNEFEQFKMGKIKL